MATVYVKPKIARVDTAAQLQTVAAGMCAGTTPIGTISLKPATTYTLTAPLILAKLSGGAYSQLIGLTIETDGALGGYYDDPASSMAMIVAPDANSPVIAIQYGRGITLRNLKIAGTSNYASNVNSAYWAAGSANNFGDLVGTESNFTAPTAARTNRYSPSCCIAIDPFGSTSQVASENRYPGIDSSYYVGNAGSSRIFVEDCVASNSQVGVLVGAGVTGNSSECTFTNLLVRGCKWGVSICHNQAKNLHFRGLSFNGCWGVVTGAQHGAQNGPLPCITNLDGSLANHLLERGSGASGPFTIDSGLVESIMRVSPTSLTGGIGSASAALASAGVIRNMTLNWAGGNSDTTPQIHAGCAPLTFDNCRMFAGSTKKTIISTSTNAWSDGNLLGLGVIFRGCNILMNDVTGTSAAADAIGLPASHVDDWIYFDNSWVTGVSVAPNNTRLIPLNGRGGL